MLDILVQGNRDKKTTKEFFCKTVQGLRYVPLMLVTDKVEELQCGQDRFTCEMQLAVSVQRRVATVSINLLGAADNVRANPAGNSTALRKPSTFRANRTSR